MDFYQCLLFIYLHIHVETRRWCDWFGLNEMHIHYLCLKINLLMLLANWCELQTKINQSTRNSISNTPKTDDWFQMNMNTVYEKSVLNAVQKLILAHFLRFKRRWFSRQIKPFIGLLLVTITQFEYWFIVNCHHIIIIRTARLCDYSQWVSEFQLGIRFLWVQILLSFGSAFFINKSNLYLWKKY